MKTLQHQKNNVEPVNLHYAHCLTSLGRVLIGATERGICFLQFGDDKELLLAELQEEFPLAEMKESKEKFSVWIKALNEYLTQHAKLNPLPLDLRGTAFQRCVWDYVQTIPSGEVRSYKEVAEAIGKPKAVRAVASACAKNRVALAVPCHRVLRGDGTLAGYRWGIERKHKLIELERELNA